MPSAEPATMPYQADASGGSIGRQNVASISPRPGFNRLAGVYRAASYGLAFVCGLATMFAIQSFDASRPAVPLSRRVPSKVTRTVQHAPPFVVRAPDRTGSTRREETLSAGNAKEAFHDGGSASGTGPADIEVTMVLQVAGVLEPTSERYARLPLATGQAVAFIDVKPGDRVEKGWQVFSHWESPDRLQASKTELAKSKVMLDVAKLQADAAERTAARLRKLEGRITEQELQDAETAASIRRQELEALQLAVSELESRFAAQKFEFDQAFVTTPIEGVVAAVDIALGERRQAGGPFRGVTVVDPTVLQCRCLLDQRQVSCLKRLTAQADSATEGHAQEAADSSLKSGENAQTGIALRAIVESEGRTWQTKVLSVGVLADAASGLTPLLLEVQNSDEALRSGERVNVSLSPWRDDKGETRRQ